MACDRMRKLMTKTQNTKTVYAVQQRAVDISPLRILDHTLGRVYRAGTQHLATLYSQDADTQVLYASTEFHSH